MKGRTLNSLSNKKKKKTRKITDQRNNQIQYAFQRVNDLHLNKHNGSKHTTVMALH